MNTKKQFFWLFYTLLLISLFIGCKNVKNEKAEKSEQTKTEESQALDNKELKDEMYMNSLIENLTGIEYFYVKYRTVYNDKEHLYNSLLSLLKYKNDANYNKLQQYHNTQHKVKLMDTKSGYLVVEGTESINYYTYWNLTDGSGNKLMALVSRDCGPACTDAIWFYRIVKDNTNGTAYKFEKTNTNDIIKRFNELPEILLGHEIDDYYPISYNLPQKGKNISMCNPDDINLIIEDDDSLERNGKCIELIWDGNEGTFTPEI